MATEMTSKSSIYRERKTPPITIDNELFLNFLKQKGGAYPVIESFNHFIRDRISEIILGTKIKKEDGRVEYSFGDINIRTPSYIDSNESQVRLTPDVARRRMETYSFSLYVSLFSQEEDGPRIKVAENIHLGDIPAMVRSDADHEDTTYDELGGYFIIKGQEKALKNVEILRFNEPLIYSMKRREKNKNGLYQSSTRKMDPTVRMTSVTSRGTSIVQISEMDTRYLPLFWFTKMEMFTSLNPLVVFYFLELSTMSEGFPTLGFIDKTLERIKRFAPESRHNEIELGFYTMKANYHYVLGIRNDEIPDSRMVLRSNLQYVCTGFNNVDELKGVDFYRADDSTVDAKYPIVMDLFYTGMFTQMNTEDDVEYRFSVIDSKANTLAYMIYKIIEWRNGVIDFDDRDSWGYKKVKLAGNHMEEKFIRIWNTAISDIENNTKNKRGIDFQDIKAGFSNKFTKDYMDAFNKGVWGTKDGSNNLEISQVMERENVIAMVSVLRKVQSPSFSKGSILEKRMIHNSQWGIICPAMTPESQICGLIKELACTVFISQDHKAPLLDTFIPKWIRDHPGKSSLFYNGIHMGFCSIDSVYKKAVGLRRSRGIRFDTGIWKKGNALWIYTTAGRACRPLLIVENGELVIEQRGMWNRDTDDLLDEGCVEYIDANEQVQEYILIAQDVETFYRERNDIKFTHCEIDQSAIYGTMALSVPFAQMNQGARISYQSQMAKQALGPDTICVRNTFFTTLKTSVTGSLPIAQTDIMKSIGGEKYPCGENLILAITTYGGYNQEDALIVNRASIERGMFHMIIYHSESAVFSKDEISDMPKGKDIDASYSKLDPETLVVRPGEYVESGDCLVAKVSKMKLPNGMEKVTDESVYLTIGKSGIVDEVLKTQNGEGKLMYRIRIAEFREPIVGDKLVIGQISQKGIISAILPEHEMPYTADGVRPDIIFSPFSIPSRMTLTAVLQPLANTYAIETGNRYNASPHKEVDIQRVYEGLESLGYSRDGKQQLTNGRTGERMQADIFIGPCYVQLLRHMVAYKMQARSYGKVEMLTMQPVQGIRREGGLRLGEMERDAIVSHAAVHLLRERFMVSSDLYRVVVCDDCGSMATIYPIAQEIKCDRCANKNIEKFKRVEMPYSFRLLIQTLAACNFKISLKTVKRE